MNFLHKCKDFLIGHKKILIFAFSILAIYMAMRGWFLPGIAIATNANLAALLGSFMLLDIFVALSILTVVLLGVAVFAWYRRKATQVPKVPPLPSYLPAKPEIVEEYVLSSVMKKHLVTCVRLLAELRHVVNVDRVPEELKDLRAQLVQYHLQDAVAGLILQVIDRIVDDISSKETIISEFFDEVQRKFPGQEIFTQPVINAKERELFAKVQEFVRLLQDIQEVRKSGVVRLQDGSQLHRKVCDLHSYFSYRMRSSLTRTMEMNILEVLSETLVNFELPATVANDVNGYVQKLKEAFPEVAIKDEQPTAMSIV